jgi:RNA polymerase sigma-70 factor (ECF subfamily)
MPPSNDLEWLRAAIDQHQAGLLRFAAALVGSRLADDVVQDTFLKLLTVTREQVEGHLRPWLFTVCRNRALEIKRRERRETDLEEEEEMRAEDPPPDEVAEQRHDRKALQRFIEELPEKHRDVVALRFAGGLSYREIAGVTGLTETNVGFVLHTALKKLKKRLAEGGAAARRAS